MGDRRGSPPSKLQEAGCSLSTSQTFGCTVCEKKLTCEHLCIHPYLSVCVCSTCYSSLTTSKYTVGTDGNEDRCTWSGKHENSKGSTLFCCDFCPAVFDCDHLRRRLGEKVVRSIQKTDLFKCYVCSHVGLRLYWDEARKLVLLQQRLQYFHEHATKTLVPVGCSPLRLDRDASAEYFSKETRSGRGARKSCMSKRQGIMVEWVRDIFAKATIEKIEDYRILVKYENELLKEWLLVDDDRILLSFDSGHMKKLSLEDMQRAFSKSFCNILHNSMEFWKEREEGNSQREDVPESHTEVLDQQTKEQQDHSRPEPEPEPEPETKSPVKKRKKSKLAWMLKSAGQAYFEGQ